MARSWCSFPRREGLRRAARALLLLLAVGCAASCGTPPPVSAPPEMSPPPDGRTPVSLGAYRTNDPLLGSLISQLEIHQTALEHWCESRAAGGGLGALEDPDFAGRSVFDGPVGVVDFGVRPASGPQPARGSAVYLLAEPAASDGAPVRRVRVRYEREASDWQMIEVTDADGGRELPSLAALLATP